MRESYDSWPRLCLPAEGVQRSHAFDHKITTAPAPGKEGVPAEDSACKGSSTPALGKFHESHFEPGGFYAAAVRAIEIVGHALENYEPPVYVRNEIVHNGYGIER
jgi:hypothetical protein